MRGCSVIMHKTDIQKLCKMPGWGGTFITMNTLYNRRLNTRIIGPYRVELPKRIEGDGLLSAADFIQLCRGDDVELPPVKDERVSKTPVRLGV